MAHLSYELTMCNKLWVYFNYRDWAVRFGMANNGKYCGDKFTAKYWVNKCK